MSVSFFIPKKINVGYQERSGTYTGKLAYVIYFDEKGKLRKEASWNSWRDKKIENEILDNEPMSGFVLNKKAGGYSTGWNHRQTYVRVYDPRGFEFEITVPNLLYILENATSTKGKGLEGNFVYGWDGKDLVLIPTDAPDYKELIKINELRHSDKKIGAKDLIIGATYKSFDNVDLIYLGRFYESNGENKETKAYFFYDRNSYSKIKCYKSLSGKILDIVDEKCAEDYAHLFDELTKDSYYSERDPKKDRHINYTLEEFELHCEKTYYGCVFYTSDKTKYHIEKHRNYWYGYNNDRITYDVYTSERNRKNEKILDNVTLDTIFSKFNPMYLVTYKSNGELIKEWKNNGK